MEMEEKKDEAGLGTPGLHRRTVCVVGHKNPDTDSICSAISYAYLKNQEKSSYTYLPMRAGQINTEDAVCPGAIRRKTSHAFEQHRHQGKGYGTSGRCRACGGTFP